MQNKTATISLIGELQRENEWRETTESVKTRNNGAIAGLERVLRLGLSEEEIQEEITRLKGEYEALQWYVTPVILNN